MRRLSTPLFWPKLRRGKMPKNYCKKGCKRFKVRRDFFYFCESTLKVVCFDESLFDHPRAHFLYRIRIRHFGSRCRRFGATCIRCQDCVTDAKVCVWNPIWVTFTTYSNAFEDAVASQLIQNQIRVDYSALFVLVRNDAANKVGMCKIEHVHQIGE